MEKKDKRDAFNATLVQKTADITKKETDYVYKVIRGDRKSELVMIVYMGLYEGFTEVENNLLKQATQLVPFN